MRRRRLLAIAMVTLALGLAACGSDDEPDDVMATSTGEAPMDDDESDSADDQEMSEDPRDEEMSEDDMSDEGTSESMAGPQFTATTIDGEPFDGSSLAGKPAVLWFWAPWCPICAGQAPAVRSVAVEHQGEVTVIGIAGLADADEMPEFVDRTGTGELTHLSDPDGELWRMYDVAEQSTYVLLDSSGEPVASGKFSDDDLADRVAELE